MLFMGTETYPDENAYQAYLSSHGGSSNAYTDQENTVYYFDVQPDHFEGALDIFASFFVCPLFNESSTMREINAVDSENSKNLQSDMWRSWQLLKSMAKSSHPFSNFSTGNLQTLKETTEAKGLNIRDLLLSFYADYYSANLMKVCVYGKEDLDTLQSYVVRMFSKVPNKNLNRPAVPSDPFGADELGKIVRMIPIRSACSSHYSYDEFTIDTIF
jgi:insulysin